jgi:threonyl-tRNA synthetase
MFQNLVLHAPASSARTYEEVNAPQVLDKSLWETSGHWGWYKENMFRECAPMPGDDEDADRVCSR